MTLSIPGTDPQAVPEIEEAAFALAKITAEYKTLGKLKEKAEALLRSRMAEFGCEAYSGIGVRCHVDTTVRAKVECDLDLADDDQDVSLAVEQANDVVAKKRGRKAKG